VKTIGLRASAQPRVVYEVAVVKSSRHLRAAYRYVTQLVRPRGQAILAANGFGRRPRTR
jgi:ABC-type molybdate transport system substrate-binding protein